MAALSEDWGDAVWSAESIGSIAYLTLFGSAVAFVTLTVLLRHISAQAMSVNHSDAPDLSNSWPKKMNMTTMPQMIVIGTPSMATGSIVKYANRS